MKYDCMTPEELALWLTESKYAVANTPCVDCPLSFQVVEKAAGRCDREYPSQRGTPHEDPQMARMARAASQRAYHRRTAGSTI